MLKLTTLAAITAAATLTATAASAALIDPTTGTAGNPTLVASDDGITATFVANDSDGFGANAPTFVFDNNDLGINTGSGGSNTRIQSDAGEFLSFTFGQNVFLDRFALSQASGDGENVTINLAGSSFVFEPSAASPLTGAPAGVSVDPSNNTALLFASGQFLLTAGDIVSITPNAGVDSTGAATDTRLFFDTVSVSAVPEPASALAGIAGLGLLVMRRRR